MIGTCCNFVCVINNFQNYCKINSGWRRAKNQDIYRLYIALPVDLRMGLMPFDIAIKCVQSNSNHNLEIKPDFKLINEFYPNRAECYGNFKPDFRWFKFRRNESNSDFSPKEYTPVYTSLSTFLKSKKLDGDANLYFFAVTFHRFGISNVKMVDLRKSPYTDEEIKQMCMVRIDEPIYLDIVSQELGVSEELLNKWNLNYDAFIYNSYPTSFYNFRIPKDKLEIFLQKKQEIFKKSRATSMELEQFKK